MNAMHNIQSPRADDASIEAELASKAVAPRVSMEDIEANIASEHYFTAEQGALGAFVDPLIRSGESTSLADVPGTFGASLELLTLCVLVLRNGFTVVGKSACASPENFDAAIGRKIARADAVNQMWPLMGYALKERLHNSAAADAYVARFVAEVKPAETTFLDHLRTEHAESRERMTKLEEFLVSERVVRVSVEQLALMGQQLSSMRDYEARLRERLDLLEGKE